MVHIYLDVDAPAAVVDCSYSHLVDDVEVAGEESVMSINAGALIRHKVEPLSLLAVYLIAQRKTVYFQFSELLTGYSNGNSEEWISTYSIINFYDAAC